MIRKILLTILILGISMVGRSQATGVISYNSGTTLPPTCTPFPANVFYQVSGSSSTGYYCSATNTWSLISSGPLAWGALNQPMSVAYIGDSWTADDYITGALRTFLQQKYGNAGLGYVPFDECSTGVRANIVTYTGTHFFPTNSNCPPLTPFNSLNIGYISNATASESIAVTQTATDFQLFYPRFTGYGSITWQIDSGTVFTINEATTINILNDSSVLSCGFWCPSSATVAAATITDPFGGTNSKSLTETTANAEHDVFYGNNAPTSVGLPYVYSVYVTPGLRTYGAITVSNGSDFASCFYDFNLSVPQGCPAGYTMTMTPAANGWFRIALYFTAKATTQTVYIAPSSTGTPTLSYPGNASAPAIYFYGPQLTLGSDLAPYEGTTGSTWTTPPASPVATTLHINALTNASHSFTTAVSSGSAYWYGISSFVNGAGALVHTIGMPGATASNYVSLNASQWEQQLSLLNPNVVVITFGVNELIENIPPATQAVSLNALISRVKVAVPNATIILAPPVDVGVTGTYGPMSNYIASQKALAYSIPGVIFIDNSSRFGSFSNWAQLNWNLQNNLDHPNATGGQEFATPIGTLLK